MFEVCNSLKSNKTPPQNVKKSLFKCAFDADVKSKGPLCCALRFDLAEINLLYCRHLLTPCYDWDPSTLKEMNNENCLNTMIWKRIHICSSHESFKRRDFLLPDSKEVAWKLEVMLLYHQMHTAITGVRMQNSPHSHTHAHNVVCATFTESLNSICSEVEWRYRAHLMVNRHKY